MICPYCHADNKYDALTCDFCLHELPMTKKRIEEIKKQKKIEKKGNLHNSVVKIIGLCLGILCFIAVIIIAWIKTKG